MMSEQNKAINRRIMEEVFGKGNVDLVDELVAQDVVDHNPMPGQAPGRETLLVSIKEEILKGLPVSLHSIGPEVGPKDLTRLFHQGGKERNHGRQGAVVQECMHRYLPSLAHGRVYIAQGPGGAFVYISAQDDTMHDGMRAGAAIVIDLSSLEIRKDTLHPGRTLSKAARDLMDERGIHRPRLKQVG